MLKYAQKTLKEELEKLEILIAKKIVEREDLTEDLKLLQEKKGLEEETKYTKTMVRKNIGKSTFICTFFILGFTGLGLVEIQDAIFYLLGSAAIIGGSGYALLESYKSKQNKLLLLNMEEGKQILSEEELIKRLEKVKDDIKNYRVKRQIYEDNLKEIRSFEKIQKRIETPFYQADTIEQYTMLLDMEEKASNLLETFLNEKIDYPSVHLEIDQQEENIHISCGKKIVKTLSKD